MEVVRKINGYPIGVSDGLLMLDITTADGTHANHGNTYSIRASTTIDASTCKLFTFCTDIELQDGYVFKWSLNPYNDSGTQLTTLDVYSDNNTVLVAVPSFVSYFGLNLAMESKSSSDFYPLRIANVGTAAIQVMPKNESESDAIDALLRDGSNGNLANSNYVATVEAISIESYDYAYINTGIELSDGQRFAVILHYYSRYGIANKTDSSLFAIASAYYTDESVIRIENTYNARGIGIALSVVDANGNFVPQRIKGCNSRIVVQRGRYIDKSLPIEIIPIMENGSVGNAHNTYAVGMEYTMPTNGAGTIRVRYTGDLNDGDTLSWQLRFYDTDEILAARSNTSHVVRDFTTEYFSSNFFETPILPLEKGFALAVYRKDSSGNFVTLRHETHPKCVAVELIGTSLVVDRNKDVLDKVFASSYYALNGIGVFSRMKMLSILVATDVHMCLTEFGNAIVYLNESPSIDCGMCLGDMAASNYAESSGEWYTRLVNESNRPFYTVIGNHDGGNSNQSAISGTKQQVFNKWIQPTLETMRMPLLDKTYYLIDFPSYNVSVVVLDNYDVPDTTYSQNNFVVSRGVEAISQEQVNWLLTTLENLPSSRTLVVARHSVGSSDMNGQEGTRFVSDPNKAFTMYGKSPAGSEHGYVIDPIPDIVEAWRTGGVISNEYSPAETYAETLPTLQVSKSFASRGTGKFGFYLVGHSHFDAVSRHERYGHLCLCFSATANDLWQNIYGDLPRSQFGKSSDCLTVVSVDTDRQCVNLVRVGANIPYTLKERTMESIPFFVDNWIGRVE